MAEKHRVIPSNHGQFCGTMENDYDANNSAPKPMELTSESKPDTARPSNTKLDYDSATGAEPPRSPSTKRPAAPVTDLTLRPTKRRHEGEISCSQHESTDAVKPSHPAAGPRPAQQMARAVSTHKPSHSSKVRPRAHSLPARLGPRSDWLAQQIAERQLQHIPPVNLKTLRELELSEFYRNPKLRHDVVFDAQLHFRPNNDGTRGLKKKVDSQEYWQMVLVECEVLLNIANKKGTIMRPQDRPLKIPVLLATMRDILLTLVPRADREEVESSLDSELLMQQLEHGILDLKRMSLWLARIFKAHCAPMRDQWVDQMVCHFQRGVDKSDGLSLMEGWKSIFGILEAMKLDVANHQIRTLRPHLISTAVVFEQSYFQSRIEQGRLETQEAKHWYQKFFSQYKAQTGSEDHVDCFMRATLDMVTPSKRSLYHSTFLFDYERLDAVRDDIREAICLRVAILLYRQLVIGAKRDPDDKDICKLLETISAVLGHEGGSDKFVERSADVALSVAHIACGAAFPSAAVVKMAENWLAKHLQFDSPIYRATEASYMKEIGVAIQQTVKGWTSPAVFPIAQVADNSLNLVTIKSIAQRLSNIAYLHWQVFGKLVYLADESNTIPDQKLGDFGINLSAAIGNKEIIWNGDRFTSP